MRQKPSRRNRLIREFYARPQTNEIIFAEDGSKFGIVKADKFLGAKYFIGEFDERNLPLKGEFIFANLYMIISRNSNNVYHAKQLDPENLFVQHFSFRLGSDMGDLQDLKYLDQESKVLRANIDADTVFGIVLDLEKIASQINTNYRPKEISLSDVPTKLRNLKAQLDQEKPLTSVTSYSEYGLRDSKEANIIAFALFLKIATLRQDDYGTEILLATGLGNCTEFAYRTQIIAKNTGIQNIFILTSSPGHVFNIISDEGKTYVVDSWDHNNIFEFTPENFYRQANLHGLTNLKIVDGTSPRNAAQELIQKVTQAAFKPEYNEIIRERISQKISELDPNNYYFHEHARELFYLIDYFDLGEDLKTKLQEDYLQKFNPNINPELTAMSPHIIYDLFCYDSLNPHENYQNISRQVLTKLSETQEESVRMFKQYEKGLDPRSLPQEIGGFAELIEDDNLPLVQKIDAEGYYAVYKFRIAESLYKLAPEARPAKIAELRETLEKHFSLQGEITFAQILEHTESYAKSLIGKQQGEFKNVAESSRISQATSVLLQMPTIGGKCDDFAQIAEIHSKAEQNNAYMESDRLSTRMQEADSAASKAEIHSHSLRMEAWQCSVNPDTSSNTKKSL